MMYCAYDSNHRVVAFHDEYDVVEKYIKNVIASHDECPDLHIGKVKKKKLKKLEDFDDLYLVRYAHTYVQSGYMVFLEMLSSQHIEDQQQCKDMLLKILECNTLSNKERKHIEKSVKIIDRILEESKEFTPSITELKGYEQDYYPYLYNKGVF